MEKTKIGENRHGEMNRRDFLKISGAAAIGIGVGGMPGLIWIDESVAAVPASEGYLLVDTKKCQGCVSCMLACSLVHEGVENLSLARIQVIQDSFRKWPHNRVPRTACIVRSSHRWAISRMSPGSLVSLQERGSPRLHAPGSRRAYRTRSPGISWYPQADIPRRRERQRQPHRAI